MRIQVLEEEWMLGRKKQKHKTQNFGSTNTSEPILIHMWH